MDTEYIRNTYFLLAMFVGIPASLTLIAVLRTLYLRLIGQEDND